MRCTGLTTLELECVLLGAGTCVLRCSSFGGVGRLSIVDVVKRCEEWMKWWSSLLIVGGIGESRREVLVIVLAKYVYCLSRSTLWRGNCKTSKLSCK